jgi:hypothetical protein
MPAMSNNPAQSPEVLLFAEEPTGFVAWLHGARGNANVVSDDGVTPLWVRAVQRAHMIGFALLHDLGVDLATGIPFLKQSGHEALLILLLAQLGALDTLDMALAQGLDPEASMQMATAEVADLRRKTLDRRQVSSPALHILIDSGNVQACEILLNRGASIELTDSEGNVPLHKALVRPIASKSATCTMRSLIQRFRPNLSARNSQGYTPAEYSLAYFQAVMPEAIDSAYLDALIEVTHTDPP